MIIAYSLFIIGVINIIAWFIQFILQVNKSSKKARLAKQNIGAWFIVTICAAQYIWG